MRVLILLLLLCSPLTAGEALTPAWARVFCVQEKHILTLVEAELNGGIPAVSEAFRPLQQTNQCFVYREPVSVWLKRLVLEYTDIDGKPSEVWELSSGLFTVIWVERKQGT